MAEKKRINIALEPELHKQLKVLTVEKDTTVTQFVIDAITEKIKKERETE